jgi:DNA repair protein RadD
MRAHQGGWRDMQIELRPYQQAAVDAVYEHLRTRDDNPCIVLPTGTGKSLVLGKIASDAVSLWHGRVLILAHVKELLEQNADKVRKLCPDLKVGVYSAGLKSRDTSESVIVAGIQSVYDKADKLGAFDLVVVDEAHLISPEGDGMYRTFLKDMKLMNPLVRVIGLTATPFRLKGGAICRPENILNHVCYEAGLKEMIAQGYLSPLVSRAGRAEADLSTVHTKAGEFVQDELASAMDNEELVNASCEEIVRLTKDRKSVLIFCTSIEHCKHVAERIRFYSNQECAVVTGSTSSGERAEIIARFRGEKIPADLWGTPRPPLKFLANVGVLTTGFDAPNTDCVVLMRPTQSAGLLLQMAGRCTRLSPATGKTNCLILDYGSNIMRHGPLDMIKVKEPGSGGHGGEAPVKKCPKCNALIAAGYGKCPECGYEFPPPERSNLTEHASNEGVLSGEVRDEEYDVHGVFYEPHVRRNADEGTPRTMRVDYEIGIGQYKSEWVCPEHTGYARKKFERWWKERAPDGCPIPNTVDEAVSWARFGALAVPMHITVRWVTGEKFDRISKVVLGERPEMTDELMWQLENGPLTEPPGGMPAVEDDDIPF